MSTQDHLQTPSPKAFFWASAGIVAGGAFWGIFWLPLRLFGATGLEGPIPGLIIYICTCAILAPVAVWRWRSITANWKALAVVGLLTGAAFSLYATAILMTEVVRVILLFYLTPVWGTALGVFVLGERLTGSRIVAVALALGGLIAVALGGDGRALNIGDVLALASGIAWALGSTQVYRLKNVDVVDTVMAFAVGSLVVTLVTLTFVWPEGGFPEPVELARAAPYAVICAIYVIPMLWLTIWPATVLTPGRVGLLLMSDAVVGVVSAALWAGEPFGTNLFIGTILIVSGAAVEVLRTQPS